MDADNIFSRSHAALIWTVPDSDLISSPETEIDLPFWIWILLIINLSKEHHTSKLPEIYDKIYDTVIPAVNMIDLWVEKSNSLLKSWEHEICNRETNGNE